MLTGTLESPAFFRNVPLKPVTPAVVDAARRYVEMRSLPGMLALSGGLDANRFQAVGAGRIGRVTNPMVDGSIVGVASCLPQEQLSLHDEAGIGRRAFEAIKHYAAIPEVRYGFCLPYIEKTRSTKVLDATAAQIEIYKGTEALLLQIWDELASGQVITDDIVRHKTRVMLDF